MAENQNVSATTLTLASTDNVDTLELNARGLPYRPLVIGGKQRAEFTWYPGSPSATVQMLGPEEAPIRMNGFWKERFLYDGATQQYSATYNKEPISSVMDLVDIVDKMRRSGRLYRFSWDAIQRYGHIVDFEVQWHNRFDVEWSLEFAVTAQDLDAAARPSNAASLMLLKSILDELFAQAEEIILTLEIPWWLNLFLALESLLAAIEDLKDLLLEYQNFVTGLANLASDLVNAPFDIARDAIATMTRSINAITATVNSITNRAVEQYFYWAGGQDDSPIGSQVASASFMNDIRIWGRSIQGATVFQRYDMQQQMQQDGTVSYLAQGNIDFRDIATQFYGSQDGWISLMRYNGYDSSRVSAGDLIWVPPQPTSGAAGSGGDY